MDKNHRLDSPDNESLKTIEQLSDRSGLTTIYPHAHTEWEGVDISTRDQREAERAQEQKRMILSIRRWFIPIGLLIPLPFVLAVLLISVSAEYLRVQNLWIMMVPVFATVGIWLYVSYKALHAVYDIFYAHSIKATPFFIVLASLLVLSINLIHGLTQYSHSTSIIITTGIVSLGIMAVSVILSGLLLLIWTTQRLPSSAKLAIIIALALGIGAATYLYRTM